MLNDREIAQKLLANLKGDNKNDAGCVSYHMLLGVIEGVAAGRPWPSGNVVLGLVIECLRDGSIVIKPETAHMLGKASLVYGERGLVQNVR